MNTKLYCLQTLLILTFSILCTSIAYADKCSDRILLSGEEPLMRYGIDSTQHWWAVTQPFTNGFRLIIDGVASSVYQEVSDPKFSPDGSDWAAFALDNAAQWSLLRRDTIIRLNCTANGEISFGQYGALAYSYRQGDNEIFMLNGKEYRTLDRIGRIFIACNGYHFAYSAKRGSGEVIVTNDYESDIYEAARVIGLWADGKPVFIALSGGQWRLHKGKEALSRAFENITEAVINPECTAVAIIGATQSGSVVQLYSEEYYEPIESRMYDSMHDLTIHSTKPMYACTAQFNRSVFVVFNGVEYDGGRECGKPFFTYNGSELIFPSVDQQYSFTVNGKRYVQPAAIDISRKYAVKPGSKTYAYGSSAGLVVREMSKDMAYSGTMVDETIAPRYNWRNGRYETLGRINQRLYLLTCTW